VTDHVDNRIEFDAQTAAAGAVRDWIDNTAPTDPTQLRPALLGCTPAMVAQIAVNARLLRLARQQSEDMKSQLIKAGVKIIQGDGRLDGPNRIVVSTGKGKARVDGSGQLALDPLHRVAGDLQLAAAGIEQIGGLRIGNLLGGLGGFLGGRGNNASTAPDLTTLPPVSLREGRVFIGPFRLPLQPLLPLY